MNKIPKSSSEIELQKFWKELFNTPMIPVQKLLDLNDKLFKVLLRVQELTRSREKWRLRAEKLTTKLKQDKNT